MAPGWAQHFSHTRSRPLGTFVADNKNISRLDRIAIENCLKRFFFRMEHSALFLQNAEPSLPVILATAPFRCQVSVQESPE